MRDAQRTGTETYTIEVLAAVLFRLPSIACDGVEERFVGTSVSTFTATR
jgi:hypothetical protein